MMTHTSNGVSSVIGEITMKQTLRQTQLKKVAPFVIVFLVGMGVVIAANLLSNEESFMVEVCSQYPLWITVDPASVPSYIKRDTAYVPFVQFNTTNNGDTGSVSGYWYLQIECSSGIAVSDVSGAGFVVKRTTVWSSSFTFTQIDANTVLGISGLTDPFAQGSTYDGSLEIQVGLDPNAALDYYQFTLWIEETNT